VRKLKDLKKKPNFKHGIRDKSDTIQVTVSKLPLPKLPRVIIPKPKEYRLFQNYPNPCNPETWIPYQLPEDTTVTIKIYNVIGHLVKTLSLGEKMAGMYISRNRAAYWNGRNEAGERISSGLYFYAIEAGNFRGIKRMLLVK